MKQNHKEPYKVGKKEYYTVRQFADITGRTVQSVRNLVTKGNRIRKLKMEKIAGRPMILSSELTEFPFTLPGNIRTIYHYDKNGNIAKYIPEGQDAIQNEAIPASD